MPVEYLSVEQEARYGRFAAEPTPGELERFFRLDAKALESARAKRRATTRLGWAVQWGTVRMLGTFLTEEPTSVPASVVAFVAGQLGEDAEHFSSYGARQQTPYGHAWEIRDAYGYRDFAAGEDELREFLAARVWSSLEGPRALFDRAVVWLIGSQVLLPGITTLARMVAEVRQEENDRLYATLYRRHPANCAPRWPGCWRCRRNAGSRNWSGCGSGRCASRAGRCSTPSNAPGRCGISALARSTSRRSRQPG